MTPSRKRSISADLVLASHLIFAVFAVLGGFFALFDWRVIWLHVPAVAWISIVNLANWNCPLTPLEKRLRERAGQRASEGSWTEHYIAPLIRSLGVSGRIDWLVGISILLWNAAVYGVVFWKGLGALWPDSGG